MAARICGKLGSPGLQAKTQQHGLPTWPKNKKQGNLTSIVLAIHISTNFLSSIQLPFKIPTNYKLTKYIYIKASNHAGSISSLHAANIYWRSFIQQRIKHKEAVLFIVYKSFEQILNMTTIN